MDDVERNKWDGTPRRDEVRATQYVFAAFLVFVLVFAGLTVFAYQATREAGGAPCARVPGHAYDASGCTKTDHIKMENPMLSMGSIKHQKWKSSVVIAGSFLGIVVVGTVLYMANRKIRSSSPPRMPMNYDGVMVDLDIKAWVLLALIVLTLFGIGSYLFAKLGWDAAAAVDPNQDGGYAGPRSGSGMANPLHHLMTADVSKYATPAREIFGKDTEGTRFFGNAAAGPSSVFPDHNEHGEVFGSQDTWQKISPWSERSMQADLANDVSRYESAQVAQDIDPMNTMVSTPTGPTGGAAPVVTADHVGPASAAPLGLVEEKPAPLKHNKPLRKSNLRHEHK